MKPRATRVPIKRLKRARQDEVITKMEKEILDKIAHFARNSLNSMKALVRQVGDVMDVDVKAYIAGRLMSSVCMTIEILEELTEYLMDVMEANTPSTHLVNAHLNFDINQFRNFVAKVHLKSQGMTQEVIDMKASLQEMIPSTN